MNAHDALLSQGASHVPAPPPTPTASAALSRDQFLGLGTAKPHTILVDLPGGESAFLRPMSGLAREKLEQGIGDGKAFNVRAQMAVASVCDEGGNLLFTEADVEQLNSAPWTILDAIYKASLELNGMGSSSVDAAAKN